MRLRVHGGLCNRLRAMLSYGIVHPNLTVEWPVDSAIAFGRFEDVFEPMPGLHIVEPPPGAKTHNNGLDTWVDGGTMVDLNPCTNAPKNWGYIYQALHLLPQHKESLLRVSQPPYIAMHVRRTDSVGYAKSINQLLPDDAYITWAKGRLEPRVYLATDNGTTQREFIGVLRAVGKEVLVQTPILEHAEQDRHDYRNTSLVAAAIDMYACARAVGFKGSPASSFTHTIVALHEMGGWWTP